MSFIKKGFSKIKDKVKREDKKDKKDAKSSSTTLNFPAAEVTEKRTRSNAEMQLNRPSFQQAASAATNPMA